MRNLPRAARRLRPAANAARRATLAPTLDLVKAIPKGGLHNPYNDKIDATQEAGHKLYMGLSCNGCHGGGGGGGMCPPLTNQTWIYGRDDDTLFRLVALGSAELPKGRLCAQGSETMVGPMPPFGQLIKTSDDLWKMIAWIRYKNPDTAEAIQPSRRRRNSVCRDRALVVWPALEVLPRAGRPWSRQTRDKRPQHINFIYNSSAGTPAGQLPYLRRDNAEIGGIGAKLEPMVSVSVLGSWRIAALVAIAALFFSVSIPGDAAEDAPSKAPAEAAPAKYQAQACGGQARTCRKTCRGAQNEAARRHVGGARRCPCRRCGAREQPASTIRIVYLGKEYEEPLPLSYAEEIITDKGIQGARLMIKEANQAGGFVGHGFELVEAIIPADGDIVAKAREVLAAGDSFIIADLEPKDLLAVADLPEAKNSVIMNIRSSATVLRQEECRDNIFHVIPDLAMRADALGQYLVWKKWPRWFVMRRDTPEDQDYLAQIQRAAKRFGAKVVEDRVYRLPPGARNLDWAISRCRRRSRWRRRARPSTTWCGSSTAMTISATI